MPCDDLPAMMPPERSGANMRPRCGDDARPQPGVGGKSILPPNSYKRHRRYMPLGD